MVEGQKDEKEEEVGHVDASQMRKGGRGSCGHETNKKRGRG
jgi:hypothetical protein